MGLRRRHPHHRRCRFHSFLGSQRFPSRHTDIAAGMDSARHGPSGADVSGAGRSVPCADAHDEAPHRAQARVRAQSREAVHGPGAAVGGHQQHRVCRKGTPTASHSAGRRGRQHGVEHRVVSHRVHRLPARGTGHHDRHRPFEPRHHVCVCVVSLVRRRSGRGGDCDFRRAREETGGAARAGARSAPRDS